MPLGELLQKISHRTQQLDSRHHGLRLLEGLANFVDVEPQLFAFQKTNQNDPLLPLLWKANELRKQHAELLLERFLINFEKFLQEYEHFRQLYGYALSLPAADEIRLAITASGEIYSITNEERLRHTYMIGTTGAGKSKLMECMIIQDLLAGRGGALIDPFGELFENLASFAFHYESVRKGIHDISKQAQDFLDQQGKALPIIQTRLEETPEVLTKLQTIVDICEEDLERLFPALNFKVIDVADEASEDSPNPYRINPFEADDKRESLSELVETFRAAIDRHTNTTDTDTPQLASILEAIFSYAIVECKTLDDIRDIISLLRDQANQGGKGRKTIVDEKLFAKLEQSHDETAKQAAWYLKEQLLQFSPNDFTQAINSTINRLRLIYNPAVHNFLGTPKTTLNLTQEINSKDKRRPFLLFHLPSHQKGAEMLATYLLTKIDKIIFRRNSAEKALPFFVYVDEFHEFIDDQIAENFAKVRQFGLGYVIAHQNYDQLRKDDESGFRKGCIFKNTATKLVFRVLGEDADYVAENCFEVTGKLEKITYSTSTGTTTATGYSVGESIQATRSKTKGQSESETQSESEAENWSETEGESHSDSRNWGSTNSQFHSNSQGSSFGDSAHTAFVSTAGQGFANSAPHLVPRTTKSRSSSVLSMSASGASYSSNQGGGESHGTSKSKTKGGSKSHGSSATKGTSASEGQSLTSGESFSQSLQLSQNQAKLVTQGLFSLQEERIFLSQEIKKLPNRELFVSFPGLVTHRAMTFDSLVLKLEDKLKQISGDQFYPYLATQQIKERDAMSRLLEQAPSKNSSKSKSSLGEQLKDDGFLF